jgi:hypothetical protein
MLSGSPGTTAWRVLRLQMEEKKREEEDMEGSCEYIE